MTDRRQPGPEERPQPDPPTAAGEVVDDPRDTPPSDEALSDLRAEAQAELQDLAGHWDARAADFDASDAGGVAGEQRSLLQDAVRRFSRNRTAMLALVLLTVYVLLAIFAPMLGDATSATRIDRSIANQGPSMEHPFGTDPAGRDLWLRAWIGARISLSIALAVALVILAVGIVYGSISGYVGGRIDNAMMRFLDALYGLPYLPFAIITVTVLSARFEDAPPIVYMVPALSLTTWFTAARIMRGQMLSLKTNEYVEGARAAGASPGRIMHRHVLPNTLGVMVVAIFLEIPNAILGEAFLSFLGLGVQPPDPSWGVLAEEGYRYIHSQPHLVWVPALLIATTVLAAIAIADGMRDALDPRGHVH